MRFPSVLFDRELVMDAVARPVAWGHSVWLVLAASGLELAGTGDLSPAAVTSEQLTTLLDIQKRGSGLDSLDREFREALEARHVIAAETWPAPECEPAAGPPCGPEAIVSWYLRPTFWVVSGFVYGWSTPTETLVRLSGSQLDVLCTLRPGLRSSDYAGVVPDYLEALGGLATHEFVVLVEPNPSDDPADDLQVAATLDDHRDAATSQLFSGPPDTAPDATPRGFAHRLLDTLRRVILRRR